MPSPGAPPVRLVSSLDVAVVSRSRSAALAWVEVFGAANRHAGSVPRDDRRPRRAPPPPELSVVTADLDTTVLVMEADDLSGGLDTMTAPPKRPSLPSMMTDIAMAPSH